MLASWRLWGQINLLAYAQLKSSLFGAEWHALKMKVTQNCIVLLHSNIVGPPPYYLKHLKVTVVHIAGPCYLDSLQEEDFEALLAQSCVTGL